MDRSSAFAALSTLSNLQQLRLDMDRVRANAINSCLSAVGELRQLTQLKLVGVAGVSDMRLLPEQLQEVKLVYRFECGIHAPTEFLVSLQHLTSLKQLELRGFDLMSLAAGSSVPEHLQLLKIYGCWPEDGLLGFTSLHQVTSVVLSSRYVRSEHIELLHHLPQLQTVSLNLEIRQDMLQEASPWHGLPLEALELQAGFMAHSKWPQLMQHIAAATGLTRLEIVVPHIPISAEFPALPHDVAPGTTRLAICEHLVALTRLSSLVLSIGSFEHSDVLDAQHLSALVALTNLDLSPLSSGPSLDAATVSLLALNLTRLRSLSISPRDDKRRVGSMHALPAIGRLTTLERLSLETFYTWEAERGLQFLTGLSRLTCLDGFEEASDASWNEFWATMTTSTESDVGY